MKMKNIKTIIVFIFIAIFLLIVISLSNFTYKSTIGINGKVYNVEVAETKYFLQKGLSDHSPLKDDEGMFFIFEKPDNYGFWMKDMKFPIDIIWIGQDFLVTHVEKNLSPKTYPQIFYPGAMSMYVLEVPAGQSDIINLKIGDKVKFQRKVQKNL